MSLRILCLWATWLALLVGPVVSAQAQVTESRSDIDAVMRARMEQLKIPGAALVVVSGDEIVHLAGYGVADAAGRPVTPQTPFLLASLSKSMTAVAVMQRVEAGEVELDAPIQRYLPWFQPATPITVRQLLNQTSGLDEAEGYRRNLDPDGPQALEESIRRLASSGVNRVPGSAFEYSNSNYDVLGLLVEQISGQPYGAYLQRHLFAPLEMTHASTSLAEARAAGLSRPFYPFFGRPTDMSAILPYSRATQPSAGLFGSVADLAPYMMMHLQAGRSGDTRLLSAASIETLHTPGAVIDEAGRVGYAMGWAVWPFDDAGAPGAPPPTALSHGGEWLGANHLLLLVPEKAFGLALLLNSNDPTVSSAYSNIAFDLALLALGRSPQHYPPTEGWIDRHLRGVALGLIVALLAGTAVSLRRLRGGPLGTWDAGLFMGLATLDLVLVAYLLLIRLPAGDQTVRDVLRFQPDLGLMLVVILLLTVGWGGTRSAWALRRWRADGTAQQDHG